MMPEDPFPTRTADAAIDPEAGAGDDGDDADGEASAGEATAGEAGTPARRRRRRRRRRHEAGGDGASTGVHGAPAAHGAAADPRSAEPARDPRSAEPARDPRSAEPARDPRSSAEPARDPRGAQPANRGRGAEPAGRDRDDRGAGRSRGRSRGDHGRARGHAPQGPAALADHRVEPDAQREYALLTSTFEGPTTRLDPKRPVAPTDDLELEGPTTPAIPWGKDDDGPPPEVVLAADLPADGPDDDLDPVSHPLLEQPSAQLGDDIASVVGVRFVPGGRVQWYDATEADYRHGERVVVDGERGPRLAWIAVPPARRTLRDRNLRRVIRRAGEQDLRGERDSDAERAHALRIAKDRAAALRLPLKVFRVELSGQLGRGARVNIYYTCDERLDLREFIRDVSSALGGGRVELRQLGVRDEAKAVGGIGSCGLTLCCTTWLPDFVPVSIKMAKDQGLVLSPTKVSGQCGRLKCCLVYEQAAYAELRKGLPKLGKRVIGARGEGRVVEVDVLRQRVRVSYGPGDTEVVPATEVRPLFPSGNQPVMREAPEIDEPAGDESEDSDELDEIELAASLGPDRPVGAAGLSDPAIEPPIDSPDDDPS